MQEEKMEKLTDAALQEGYLMGTEDVHSIKRALVDFMVHTVGKDPMYATDRDWFMSLAYLVRGVLSARYIKTARAQHREDTRRVYYLSMEYLPGRSLVKHLIDLDLLHPVREALKSVGKDLDHIAEHEAEAALGNGGLGRLASCFLDSLATLSYPGFGYGVRYDYGMFTQRIERGQQVEHPENWLRYGNPWEFQRPSVIYPVRFGGRVHRFKDINGKEVRRWEHADEVIAMAFDLPVSGYHAKTITNLRLWSARSTRDFDLRYFNEGAYIEAVKEKTISENLSKVLYPNDATLMGQELRLKQEYFFVCASLQDILARYRRRHASFDMLPEKVAIQLNDTHPVLAIPELMRLLMDEFGYEWQAAWDLSRKVFSYTCHTLMPEALETWPISILERILPRHLEIVYQINDVFLKEVKRAFPGDPNLLRRMSLVDDDQRRIRMAHLAIVGGHKVNGVANLHTELMKSTIFADFYRLWPDRFINMTNGVTLRAWVKQANESLSDLITEKVGSDRWLTNAQYLKELLPCADDAEFRARFSKIKQANKQRLAVRVEERLGIDLNVKGMFDTQVKRFHEYKRQLLNVLHVIDRYNRIKDGDTKGLQPRTVMFGGKAAPGYFVAKLVIRLINDMADVINHDRQIGDMLRVVFFPNYNVSEAQIIIPGSDLSEQISTAGTEASGTGNMKFALNGALTIGTLDGANIEIRDAVGEDNIFTFGLLAEDVQDLRMHGYNPWQYYNENPRIKRVLDMVTGGYFSPDEPERYRALQDVLLHGGDYYMLLADFDAYMDCQNRIDAAYTNHDDWIRKAVINVASMGHFSSDRVIHEYARDIWHIAPQNQELALAG